ncbi:calcium/sodium antiporter [Desulfohalovibrio reitneri]|uniref:calcium/sodium antiporter n=1 Tax=Desulfohalovibrio reitneri TaxID=1307759 RepID=UPI0009DE79B0|nr:calcium/sodium antiporter [Desulfohalovibrio reitneri]
MTDAVFLLIAIGLLWFSADWIVESASAVARRFGVSELAIGLTVVAFGTSAPEFLVTITAAIRGLADISLSNVVGSNFYNLGLVLGLVAMVRPVGAGKVVLYRDGMLLLGLTAAVGMAVRFGWLGPSGGLVLLLFLLGYVLILLRTRSAVQDIPGAREVRWWDYPRLLAGFAGVALGGSLMVESASSIARGLGVSEWWIGMTLVAFGTSLPELVTCLSAALKGRSDMLLGNLIGSNVFNFAGVLGLTCMLRPLDVSPSAQAVVWFNLGVVALVLVFMRTGWRIGRREGLVLVALNVAAMAFGRLG